MKSLKEHRNISLARKTFNEINNFSSTTELVNLSIDEIISEIKTNRREKKLLNK